MIEPVGVHTQQLREKESKERGKEIKQVMEELDCIQKEYDLVHCPKKLEKESLDWQEDSLHFMDNPLFEVDVDVTYNNPLFELDDGALFYFNVELDDNHKIWVSGAISNGEMLIQSWNGGQNLRIGIAAHFPISLHKTINDIMQMN